MSKKYILIIINYLAVLSLLTFSITYSIFEEKTEETYEISSDEAREYAERFIWEKFNTSEFQIYSINAIDEKENGLSETWRCKYFIELEEGNQSSWYEFTIFFDKKIMDLIFKHDYIDYFYNESNGTLVQLRKLWDGPYHQGNITYRDSTEIVPILVNHFKRYYKSGLPDNTTLDAVFFVCNYWRINYVFRNKTGDYIFSYHLYYYLDTNNIEVYFQYLNANGRRVYDNPNIYPPSDMIDYMEE